MLTIKRLWFIVWRPRRTSREIALEGDVLPAVELVTGFAVLLGLGYLVTYFTRSFPPSPADWQVWLETWGESLMAPFFPIALESYRLFMAIAIVPGIIGLWLVMAGAGKLLSMAFHGKATFRQYLGLFGFSFFPFWIIAALIDFLYMGIFSPNIVPALQLAYGPLVRTVVYLMPLVMYPLFLILGGVYTALATHAMEGFAAWKCSLVGLVTACLAITVLTMIVR